MQKNIHFSEGEKGKPLVIFINGMGMDSILWTGPSEARILGGKYPLKVLLRGTDSDMRTAYTDLKERGFPLITWNQKRPAGPIAVAVSELREVVDYSRRYAGSGIFLVCHSRGGLIARKYLEHGEEPLVRGLVTLATPHRGSTMAKWAGVLSPMASLLTQVLGNIGKKDTSPSFQRVLRFLGGKGLKELLPESRFYKNLKDTRRKGMRCLSVGGTKPDLVRFGEVSLAGVLARIAPDMIIPEELKDGLGDGMVSAASSVLPYADAHYNFHVNHAAILFDKGVRDRIIEMGESLVL